MHRLRVYDTDAAIDRHVARSTPAAQPLMHAFRAMSMDERWVNRAPDVMFGTFHGFAGEGFEFIVDDLLALPAGEAVLVDGFRVLPRLVKPLLSGPRQAVWLLPSPAFREAAFESRGSTWSIAGRTSDPNRALGNLLRRDALFTDSVAAEARTLGLATLTVDVGETVASLLARVGTALGLHG